jgi:hypothetical protein
MTNPLLARYPDYEWTVKEKKYPGIVKINTESIVVTAFVVAAIVTLSLVENAALGSISPSVYSTTSKPFSHTYGQWVADWGRWQVLSPTATNPTADPTGRNCGVDQNGPVWFLTGTTGGSAVRTCTIPAGKAILFPIINSECDLASYPTLKTVTDLVACARKDVNTVTGLQVSIDGVSLQNVTEYRVTSTPFNITYPHGNIYGAPAGTSLAVVDGYFAFLHPLPTGAHTLHFGALNPGNPTTATESFVVNVKYNLFVR